MNNRETKGARAYHEATKHSYMSVRTNPHYMDWANQPLLFKVYPELEPIRLPREFRQSGVAALSAIAETVRGGTTAIPDLQSLSQILYFSAGVTKKREYPGGEIYFRAAACTGALYEFELYVVCGDLPDLEAGVYHFGPADFSLRLLRKGDFRGVLTEATAGETAVTHAPLTIVCAGTYWRNAWKYQARTYRHFGWDNGTLLANLLAMSTALNLPARVVMGFLDEPVNRLLDLDTQKEVVFSLVPIGYAEKEAQRGATDVAQLSLKVLPLSKREVDYPLMREAYEASSLVFADEVRQWREALAAATPPEAPAELIPLRSLPDDEMSREPLEKVVLRRGSTRQFAQESITFEQMSTMLDRATRGFLADFHSTSTTLLNDLYLIVNAVEGLEPGAYHFHPKQRALELLKAGDLRDEASYLGLQQQLPGDASVNVFFLANLEPIFEKFGNRGYRAVQLEAGLLGGKLYLGAYAQGLGASGLTFFDDDVVKFFSPHAQGKSAIFLTCLGRSIKKSQ